GDELVKNCVRHAAAGDEHRFTCAAAAVGGGGEGPPAAVCNPPRLRLAADGHRRQLDRHQYHVDPLVHAHSPGHRYRRAPAARRPLPGALESSDLGRYPDAASGAEPARAVAEILSEEPAV